MSEPSLTTCGVCGGELRKVFYPAGILFKGSGFYSTDNRSKPKTSASAPASTSSESSGEKSSEKSSGGTADKSAKEAKPAGKPAKDTKPRGVKQD